MKKNVSIKVIADVICPWCFIGCSFLNKSMLKRENIKFEIDWQSYYLNPSMPYLGMDRKRYLKNKFGNQANICLLYTSPSPRDRTRSRMPSSA